MSEFEEMADAETELGLDAKVTEVMSTKVICVKAELSVRSVLMVMVEQGIGHGIGIGMLGARSSRA